MNKNIAWGSVGAGILVALTQYFGWPGYLMYIWATFAIICGIFGPSKK